jgi:hypothetical protein
MVDSYNSDIKNTEIKEIEEEQSTQHDEQSTQKDEHSTQNDKQNIRIETAKIPRTITFLPKPTIRKSKRE